MDARKELLPGIELKFPGMVCIIERCIGRGSNAIVYEAGYRDASNAELYHRVLIKELFPYEPGGHIWRDENLQICMDERGEACWKLHLTSFERGNQVHLQLLSKSPDQFGGNLNTYALNGTYYTLLDDSGGRSLDKVLKEDAPQTIEQVVGRMQKLVLALDAFHKQGLLHLDVSLDNILLVSKGRQERIVLIDYNSVHTAGELTQGDVFFSVKEGFTAPEVQTKLLDSIGPCTDLFSVACVFYALLMGAPPTSFQLNRRTPPDAQKSPLLQGKPMTVGQQVAKILKKGLCVLPNRCYVSCKDFLCDLDELEDRINGVGVTHAAIWEAGRRSVQRLVRRNPSLEFVEQEAELYPLRIRPESGDAMPAQDFLNDREKQGSVLLLGEGGMGKSTALLRAALKQTERYLPARPAAMYLPLMGRKKGEAHFITDSILMELHFDADTRTIDDARHALISLLKGDQVKLLLLLDGLNEATGEIAELIEEIRNLSNLPGLRMVISSRSEAEELPFSLAYMARLREDDIDSALAKHGLLRPENVEMTQLLGTPMMLSLFIKTAINAGRQLSYATCEELLCGYLDALCAKAACDAAQTVDYQVEAAVRLVLPSIAWEISRQGRSLDEAELYQVVFNCYRVFSGKRRICAFPQWLGHSREILGEDAQNADAWCGWVLYSILWRRLGLLVQDESGYFRIVHQILQEHLLPMAEKNRRKMHSRKLHSAAIAAVCTLVCMAMLLCAYEIWLKPKPYDEKLSAAVMNAAVIQYSNCHLQHDAMNALLSGEIDAENCAIQVKNATASQRAGSIALENMKGQGDVIAWSGQPLDFENAEILLSLPVDRAERYEMYIRAWMLVESGETGTTIEEFSAAITEVLEADADIAWLLERSVYLEHIDGMDDAQRASYESLLILSAEQENRSIDLTHGLDYALERGYERLNQAESALKKLAVMYDPFVSESEI